jgi:non-ribosomal peptide synthetase component F
VPPELFGPLSAWAAAEGSTLFMLLLAGLGTVLARWSGQADLLSGSPVAGGGRSEVAGRVVMFRNSLVLRLELDPDPSGPGTAGAAPAWRGRQPSTCSSRGPAARAGRCPAATSAYGPGGSARGAASPRLQAS